MVASYTSGIGAAVEKFSPSAIGIICSQEVIGDIASAALEFSSETIFMYGIVDSALEINSSFDRFSYLYETFLKQGYSTEEITLDATGGTTPMRLGAALGAMSRGIPMVHQRVYQKYEHGEWKRDESRPIEIVPMPNPLESTGLLREGQGVELFDRRDYGAAALIFADVARKVEGAERSLYYTGLKILSEGYAAWDVADYTTALSRLSAARKELANNFSDPSLAARAARLMEATAANLDFLAKVRGNLSIENVVDMLENARRRIEDQNRYDDGVARLYRSIEMMHQHNLYRTYAITTKDVDWGKVSEEVRGEFLERSGLERLPGELDLMRSRVLDHVLGKVPEGEEENIFRDLLKQRNNSILAHGFAPISDTSAHNFLRYVAGAVARPQIAIKARHPRLKDS